jgi:hypothetical protein
LCVSVIVPADELTESELMMGRFPKLMYTEEGKKCMERLWNETMEELKFANVKDILASIK